MLPPGVRIERIYDRTELISLTTSTVLHNLVMGIVLFGRRAPTGIPLADPTQP